MTMGFLGKITKGINKAVKKVGGGVNKAAKGAVMKGGIGPSNAVMGKLSSAIKRK